MRGFCIYDLDEIYNKSNEKINKMSNLLGLYKEVL